MQERRMTSIIMHIMVHVDAVDMMLFLKKSGVVNGGIPIRASAEAALTICQGLQFHCYNW
jgi:hypothetical protein